MPVATENAPAVKADRTLEHDVRSLDYGMDVLDAACLLDEHVPGWRKKIDLGRLDIASPCNCIMGQLYGRPGTTGYKEGIEAIYGEGAYDRLSSLEDVPHSTRAFYMGDAEDAWRAVIG